MKAFGLLTVVLLAAGCVQIPGADRAAPRYQVKTDGACLELSKSTMLSPDQFVARFEEHWTAGRKASATSLVRRFPEVGAAALRRRDASQAPTAPELALASLLDDAAQHPPGDGWRASLERKPGSSMAHAESWLAEIETCVREEKWKQVRKLAQQRQATIDRCPEHAVRIVLAATEAERRLGQTAAAEAAWQSVARTAAQLGVRWHDPSLWERLDGQRPANAAWPREVVVALAPLAPTLLHDALNQTDFPIECLVWYAIGSWRLDRGEASAALAAFQKAGAQGRSPTWDEFLQLQQARAWLALEQTPTAVSQLMPLAERADSPWRPCALALLGSAKLHDGHVQQALAFLKEALDKAPGEFPGRAEAEADLGVAYLSLGQEAQGLSHLNKARSSLLAAGALDLALLSLDNELRYLEATGQAEGVAARRREVERLQSLGSSLPDPR